MSINLVFAVMLIAHVLGDFYFQSSSVAEERKKSLKAVFKHGAIYSLCVFVVFVICMPITFKSLLAFIFMSILHLLIDILKYICMNGNKDCLKTKRYVWFIDQLLHFSSLVLLWKYYANNLYVHNYIAQEVSYLPDMPIVIFLGILCILKPVNIVIINTEFWNNKNTNQEIQCAQTIPSDVKNAGKVIGYLERLIIFMLLLYNQFSSIGFVLTAKSIARFKDIENDKNKAEYYLIGTLLSAVSVITIVILLGLCDINT